MYIGLFCGAYRALLQCIWDVSISALDYLTGTSQHGSRSFVMMFGSFVTCMGLFCHVYEALLSFVYGALLSFVWRQGSIGHNAALLSCLWVSLSCIWRQGSFLIYTGLFCDVYGALS